MEPFSPRSHTGKGLVNRLRPIQKGEFMLKIQKVTTDWKKNALPSGLTWYFIGQPKSGKTTNASSWSEKGQDGVLLLDTDLGADFVGGANVITITELNPPTREVTEDGVRVVKKGKAVIETIPPEERGYFHRSGKDKGKPMPVYSLAEVVANLEKEWDKYPYDTIVIDTIDKVNEWIEDVVKKELEISAMGEGDWGADWFMARRKNADVVKRLQNFLKKVGGNLILTSHSKQTAVQDGKVELAPALPSGLSRALCAVADVIGYTTINKEDNSYGISFEGYDERMVGSRLRPLAQKVLPFSYDAIVKEIKSYKEKGE